MSLFDNDNVVIKDSIYHHVKNGNHSMNHAAKNLCESLWHKFESYADNDFKIDMANDFLGRFWEMDLTCVMLEKYGSACVSSSDVGPDIALNIDDREKIWIECIAPNNADIGQPERIPDIKPGQASQVPDKKIRLRLTSAIYDKWKKYQYYLKENICNDDEPFVIAINARKLGSRGHDDSLPRIVRSVFCIGSEYVSFGADDAGNTVGFEFKKSLTKETIKNGTESINIDFFLEEKYSHISAVLYANTDPVNRREPVYDDYVLVHNPFAKNPLEEGLISLGCEWIACNITDATFNLRCNDYRSEENKQYARL